MPEKGKRRRRGMRKGKRGTFIGPRRSPAAQSNPAETMMSSGLNSLRI